MFESTKRITKILDTIPTYRERNKFLGESERIYEGKTAYVISCGPSLNELDFNKLKEKLKDELVICIKQSYDFFQEICDIHIYNCANIKKYDYSKFHKPLIVEATSFGTQIQKEAHLKYSIFERRPEKSVSESKEFDKWKLSKIYERPCGPGIMYEIVFYLLEYLGVNKIVTIGWDNSVKGMNSSNNHFYDHLGVSREKFVQSNDQRDSVQWQSILEEEKRTSNVIGDWNDWLKACDIELEILSPANPAPRRVKRISKEILFRNEL